MHWAAALVFGGLGVGNPRSLLDNSPLREMLRPGHQPKSIQESIDRGYLDAVTVTAAGYGRRDRYPSTRAARATSHGSACAAWDARRRSRSIT